MLWFFTISVHTRSFIFKYNWNCAMCIAIILDNVFFVTSQYLLMNFSSRRILDWKQKSLINTCRHLGNRFKLFDRKRALNLQFLYTCKNILCTYYIYSIHIRHMLFLISIFYNFKKVNTEKQTIILSLTFS